MLGVISLLLWITLFIEYEQFNYSLHIKNLGPGFGTFLKPPRVIRKSLVFSHSNAYFYLWWPFFSPMGDFLGAKTPLQIATVSNDCQECEWCVRSNRTGVTCQEWWVKSDKSNVTSKELQVKRDNSEVTI